MRVVRQGVQDVVLTDRPGDGVNLDLLRATGTITSAAPLVVTPTVGMRIRLWWLTATPSPDNTVTGRVTADLVGKGEVYRAIAVGHRQRFDGSVNGTLTVAVSAGTAEVTVHYEEVP